jgi:hypothetical protein
MQPLPRPGLALAQAVAVVAFHSGCAWRDTAQQAQVFGAGGPFPCHEAPEGGRFEAGQECSINGGESNGRLHSWPSALMSVNVAEPRVTFCSRKIQMVPSSLDEARWTGRAVQVDATEAVEPRLGEAVGVLAERADDLPHVGMQHVDVGLALSSATSSSPGASRPWHHGCAAQTHP